MQTMEACVALSSGILPGSFLQHSAVSYLCRTSLPSHQVDWNASCMCHSLHYSATVVCMPHNFRAGQRGLTSQTSQSFYVSRNFRHATKLRGSSGQTWNDLLVSRLSFNWHSEKRYARPIQITDR